jgi:WD40 repeat protein
LIHQVIGSGGMGIVYRAARVDHVFRKEVALKVVRFGERSLEIAQRFQQEREILASLDHPHIARLFDGGSTPEGLPYFVMEYVEGTPIHDYCDEHKLNVSERLKLFLAVCGAMQYAHQSLVVHRDLKPGNILVTKEGTVKLLDFGIAKLLRATEAGITACMTRQGLLVMTPEYASPEQIKGEPITTASDVYTLGVVLYELLTGHRPYRIKSRVLHEISRAICEEEPTRPSKVVTEDASETDQPPSEITREHVSQVREGKPERLKRRLEGDLDNILLKALAKEPNRRYLSVEQFANDLDRHLRGLPVIAQKATLIYRTGKFLRRNKAALAAAAAFAISVLLMFLKVESARREAEHQASISQRQSYIANIAAADLNLRSNEVLEARRRLLACPQELRGWEWRHLFLKSDSSLATLNTLEEVVRHIEQCSAQGACTVMRNQVFFALSSDGKQIFANTEHTLQSWDAQTFLPLSTWSGFGSILAVAPHAGRILATTHTFTTGIAERDHTLRVLNPFTHHSFVSFSEHHAQVTAAAFSQDAVRLVTGDNDGFVFVWGAASGRTLSHLTPGTGPVTAVAFSPDGCTIAAAFDRTIQLWNTKTDKPLATLKHEDTVSALAFNPEGSTLVSSTLHDRSLYTWDIASARELRVDSFDSAISSIAFSLDGTGILAGREDGSIHIVLASSGTRVTTLLGHRDPVVSVSVLPSGLILTADGPEIRAWDPSSAGGVMTLRSDKGSLPWAHFIVFSPNGRLVASASGSSIHLWDARSGAPVSNWRPKFAAPPEFPMIIHSVEFSPDSTYIAVGTNKGVYKWIWSANPQVPAGSMLFVPLLGPSVKAFDATSIAFSRDGKRIVCGSANGTAQLWDLATSRLVFEISVLYPVFALAFSPDGRSFATADGSYSTPEASPDLWGIGGVSTHEAKPHPSIRIWNAESGKLLVATGPHSSYAIAFSHDGTRLVSLEGGDTGGTIWDVTSGKPLRQLQGGAGNYVSRDLYAYSVLFHPDGRRVFASWGNLVQIWDVESGESLLQVRGQTDSIQSLSMSPDGNRLASCSKDGTIKIWESSDESEIEVAALVESLSEKFAFAQDAIEELQTNPKLDESVRAAAIRRVHQIGEHPQKHIQAGWEAAKSPDTPRKTYELALRHARLGCELAPWDWEAFNVQGAVQYRLGAYRAAVSYLLRAAELRVRPSVTNLLFQALAYHRLGESTEASFALAQAKRVLDSPETVIDPELKPLLQEAESAIKPIRR